MGHNWCVEGIRAALKGILAATNPPLVLHLLLMRSRLQCGMWEGRHLDPQFLGREGFSHGEVAEPEL